MENQKEGKMMNGETCICGRPGCMCGHHNGHSCLMKWLFRVALILVVFCLGYMMGELHGMVRDYSRQMGSHNYSMGMRGQDMGMQTGMTQYGTMGMPTTGTATTVPTVTQ